MAKLDQCLSVPPTTRHINVSAFPYGAAGKRTRERDAFGGLPIHLIGIAHASRTRATHTPNTLQPLPCGLPIEALPYLLDVYPIIRLSMDLSGWPALSPFDQADALQDAIPHTDHMVIQTDVDGTLLGCAETQKAFFEAFCAQKSRRRAEEVLCSVCLNDASDDLLAAALPTWLRSQPLYQPPG